VTQSEHSKLSRRRRLWIALAATVAAAASTPAQVSSPNAAGVAMGHLHFHVRDVAANRAFWVALGARPLRPFDGAEVLGFDGLLVLLSPGESSGPSAGSVVDHVALRVKSFAQIEAAGLVVERRRIEGRESGGVVSPSGDRVELFEDRAVQVPFTPDAGHRTPLAERHNRPLEVAVMPHHLHLDVPEGAAQAAQAWYLRAFGGVPGTRFHYKAMDLPGMNLNFSGVPMKLAPTKGRTLDHVGFEVKNLAAFCRRLVAAGITLDRSYAVGADGVATALLTDPWGTSIELTQGLGR
jgi:catechol 2,3-dioxygenase-like lactoylglutathione lyase family enzyme